MEKQDIIKLDSVRHDSNELQIGKITLDENYRKKWNVHQNDFICLARNGKLINNSLYRMGGFTYLKDIKNNYFLLLKYTEDYYPDEITKNKSEKPHLEGKWCIIDKNGIEKREFEPFSSPFLIENSCIYVIDRKYYNIETNEFYCYASHECESENYLFLENSYDKDISKRGVLKIDKKTGKYELFK